MRARHASVLVAGRVAAADIGMHAGKEPFLDVAAYYAGQGEFMALLCGRPGHRSRDERFPGREDPRWMGRSRGRHAGLVALA